MLLHRFTIGQVRQASVARLGQSSCRGRTTADLFVGRCDRFRRHSSYHTEGPLCRGHHATAAHEVEPDGGAGDPPLPPHPSSPGSLGSWGPTRSCSARTASYEPRTNFAPDRWRTQPWSESTGGSGSPDRAEAEEAAKPITDPAVLEKRKQALAKARAARAEKRAATQPAVTEWLLRTR